MLVRRRELVKHLRREAVALGAAVDADKHQRAASFHADAAFVAGVLHGHRDSSPQTIVGALASPGGRSSAP